MELAEVRRRFAADMQQRLGLRSRRLVEAFASVPRERFVGAGPWQVSGGDPYRSTPDADPAHLYADVMVALDPGRELNNGNPLNHARWIDCLDVNEGEHVVHIGAGSGYYTTILAAIVGETGAVTAAEVDRGLLSQLRANTASMRWVRAVEPRGVDVEFETADRIYVNCSLTRPPPAWLSRLREGGSMILPLMEMGPTRHGGVFCVRRLSRADHAAQFLVANRMFPCDGGRHPDDERAIAAAFERGGAQRVRSLRIDEHPASSDCWLHAPSYCLSERATGP